MKEEQFTLEEQVFRFEKEETSWRLDLKRSEVDSQDLRNLWILDLHHPLFLEQSMTADQAQSICLIGQMNLVLIRCHALL